MTSCTGSVRGGFGGFEKSQLVELSFSVQRRRLTFGARRDQTSSLRWGAARGSGSGVGGQMEKSA